MQESTIRARKWGGLAACVGLLLAISVPFPTYAQGTQWDALYDRIIRIEQQMKKLRSGGAVQSAPPQYSGNPTNTAEASVRIDNLENQMRQLLGQVQELSFQVRQLQERLKQFSSDVEFRLQKLDGRKRKSDAGEKRKRKTAAASAPAPDSVESIPEEPSFSDPSYSEDGLAQEDLNNLANFIVEDETGEPVELHQSSSGNTLGTMPLSALQNDSTFDSAVPAPVEAVPLDGSVGGGEATPEMLYENSYDSMLKRKFASAEKGFQTFLSKYRRHKLAGNAQYWLGESYYARKQYKLAAGAFLKGYKNYSKGPKAPHSLLKLGMTLRRLGQKSQACATFVQLGKQYPRAAVNVKKQAQRESSRAGC